MRYFSYWFALLLILSPGRMHAQTPAATIAILEGDVVNSATGAPIAGARVKVDTQQAEPLYSKSDASGHFLFNNLPPNFYRVSVEAPGFVKPTSTSVDLAVHRAKTTGSAGRISGNANCCVPATVTGTADADGNLHARISIPMVAYAVITGKVTDPNGVPIEGCPVEILMKRPDQTRRTASNWRPGRPLPDGKNEIVSMATLNTNDKGEFRAGRLEPGTWYVVANKSGLPGVWESGYRITYYPRALDLASAKPLELAAGEQARANIQIARQNGIHVAGRLIKPAGEESSSGSLLFTNIVLVSDQNYLTNANGPFTTGREDYEFTDVLPGKYTLMALTRDATSDPFGGNQKPLFGLVQPFEAGDRDMSGVDLALQPLRDLAGAVTFPEGCTPFPVRIDAYSRSPIAVGQAEAVSGADGKFVLHGLVPGKFTVSVSNSSGPGQPVRAASMRLGDRDVQKDGFEAPVSGDEPLRIDIPCGNSGRQR